jgi:hypothetical protein
VSSRKCGGIGGGIGRCAGYCVRGYGCSARPACRLRRERRVGGGIGWCARRRVGVSGGIGRGIRRG